VLAAGKAVSLAEIGAALNLPPPTVHRVVGNLEERGFLKRALGSPKLLLPGARLIDLSGRVLESAATADESHSVLENLAQEIQEHCQIGTISHGEVLYIDSVRVRHASGLQLEQGRSAPLHCTSMGKVYLASMREAELEKWLQSAALSAITDSTITDPDLLRDHLRKVRKQGWASSNQEYGAGIVGCAVRIPLSARRAFLCVGISAPAARVPHEKLPDFIAPLRHAAEQIGAALKR
jgi:IclR family transcriptional regulator, acetate operon repressor